jgi:CRP/FNR family transcriptional regulator, dissimilatory nitrate respiration regulator
VSAATPKSAQIRIVLQMSPIFAGVSDQDLDELAAFCQLKRLEKGAFLFREHDPYHGFYIVRSGILKIFRSSPEGKEQVLRLAGPGESLAEAPMGDRRSFPASVQAERTAEVVLVPAEPLRSMMMKNPQLALSVLGSMAGQLRHLVTLIDDLTLKNVEARFALYLIRLSGKIPPEPGVRIEIPVTWQVLASHLGCTGESLSRLLRLLRNRGTLKVEGRTLTIQDPDSLVTLGDL